MDCTRRGPSDYCLFVSAGGISDDSCNVHSLYRPWILDLRCCAISNYIVWDGVWRSCPPWITVVCELFPPLDSCLDCFAIFISVRRWEMKRTINLQLKSLRCFSFGIWYLFVLEFHSTFLARSIWFGLSLLTSATMLIKAIFAIRGT